MRRTLSASFRPPRNAQHSKAASPGGRTEAPPGTLARGPATDPASGSSRMSRRPRPDRRHQARRTSETEDRNPAAPSVAARSGSNREAATGSPAKAAQARSTGGPSPCRAPQTAHPAPQAPGSQDRASPEADDPKEPAPPDRHRKKAGETHNRRPASHHS